MLTRGTILRRLRSNPLRFVLVLLQLFLAALVMTVALTAYLSADGSPSERFSISAVVHGEYAISTADVFFGRHAPALLELAPSVEAVATQQYGFGMRPKVEVDGERFMLTHLSTVSPGYFGIMGIEASRGSLFTQGDAERAERLIVLSDDAATVIFGEADPTGTQVTLMPTTRFSGQPEVYRVSGTFNAESSAAFGMGFEILPAYLLAADGTRDGADTLMVQAKAGEEAVAREEMLAVARSRYASSLGQGRDSAAYEFEVREPRASSDHLALADTPLLIFALFGVIALLIGAIGVFATTMVEVSERTREIGILRALGASARRISLQFAAEAAALALTGGLLGIVAAAFLLPALQAQIGAELFAGTELAFDPGVGLTVLLVMVGLSALLAWLPARQAGQLHPVEVLMEA